MKNKTKKIPTPFVATQKHRENKIRSAIKLLNDIVKIRLAPSQINGVGVFAMRDIKKGDKLYTDIIPHQFDVPYSQFKKLRPEITPILLGHFPLILSGSHFMYPVTKFSAFLNHSDDPNYDAKEDKALRDIKQGEEVTEDYKLIENWKEIFTWLA